MDIKAIIISIIALCVSIASFLWNVFTWYKNYQSKIKVDVSLQSYYHLLGGVDDWIGFIQIQIVNLSKFTKVVNQPYLKVRHKVDFCGKQSDSIHFAKIGDIPCYDYPIKIAPGELVELKVPINKGCEWFINDINRTFKVVVTDTAKKEYKSKSVNMSPVISMMKHNKNIDSQTISCFMNNFQL